MAYHLFSPITLYLLLESHSFTTHLSVSPPDRLLQSVRSPALTPHLYQHNDTSVQDHDKPPS